MHPGSEKRQFKRYAVSRPAVLKHARVGALSCEIADFCQKGVLVTLAAPAAHGLPLTGLNGKDIQLEIHANLAGAGSYLVLGKVVRVLPDSLGIEVAHFPAQALQDLMHASQRTLETQAGTVAHALSRDSAHAAMRSCHEQFTAFIQEVIQHFFAHLQNRLNQAAERAASLEKRWTFNTAFPLVAARRGDFERAFLNENYLQQHLATGSTPSKQSDELALVDIADFEDWLSAAQLINHLEADHQYELDRFESRYAVLAARPVTRHNNPYGPHALFQTFRTVLLSAELESQVNALLYRAFSESIAAHFDNFYKELGNTLAFIQRSEPIQDTPPKKTAAAANQPASVPLSSPREAGAAPDQADSGLLEYRLDTLLQRLNPSRSPASAAPGNIFRSPPRDLSGAQTRTSATLAQSLVPATGNMLKAVLHSREPGSGQPRVSIALDNLLNALDAIRRRQREDGADDSISVRQQLAGEIPQLGNGAAADDQYHQTLQLFDALVGAPITDATPGADIRMLLRKIELPLLKLALLDERFLGSDDHPARHTINLFERYYIAADDQGKLFDPKLFRFLDRQAQRIAEQFETNPAVFDEVNTTLGNLLVPIEDARKMKVRRIQLLSEGTEKIQLAHEQVRQDLRQRLGGKAVPMIVLELLDCGWRHHLQMTYLREGAERGEYLRALAVLDELLALLAQDAIAQGIAPGALQNLLGRVADGLRQAAFDAAAGETVQSLAAQLQGKIPVLRQYQAAAEPEPEGVADTAIADLPIGDWLCFHQGHTRTVYQLVWSNSAGSRYAFTNRSATKKRNLDQRSLVQGFQDGTITRIAGLDTPFLERSAHKVMLDAYARIYHQATHDAETGLLNRKGLMNRLETMFKAGASGQPGGILCLIVFDQLGAIHHGCGQADAAASLRGLVATLSQGLGAQDVLARLGEDTFAMLFHERSLDDVHATVQDMVSSLGQHRVRYRDKSFALAVNVGIAPLSTDTDSPSALLQHARSACVAAKSMGANTIQHYTQDSPKIQDDEALFECAGLIDQALGGNLLRLTCQKIQPILTDQGRLPHYEILLDVDATLNTSPAGFIRAGEKWKRSSDIDLWVLRNSFAWMKENAALLENIGGFSINLSGLSLVNDAVLAYIEAELAGGSLPPSKIIFEVTETAAIERLDAAQRFIARVRAHGCRVSLDDFGSGYASFAYLKNLKVDYLKIDGVFVRDLMASQADHAMVKSMHEVGHALGLMTIAEYVENAEILDRLKNIGIDYAQGYHIGKPILLDKLLIPPGEV